MLFPSGLRRALTMSFDDGRVFDRRLVAIFNAHGIRGTFNLISSTLDKDGYVTRAEVKSLFAGHEVAAHTVTHPPLTRQTDEVITREVMDNRADLERLVGYPVRGLAYPGGDADQRVADFLPKLGIVYARLVSGTTWMATPDKNPTAWNCTCHHNDCLRQVDRLLKWDTFPALLSVWGHSYEFEEKGNWSLIEEFCTRLGGRKDIWYATNIEVFDYLAAVRALRVSADGSFIENPSALPVWIDFEGRAIELKPGVITRVKPD
ncbi:MAG: polysaccharide deacetylase family protein [Armatimonadetes bacterium]|nr:polysaccharide deacetylase family protein [Armatimonadota bacterium]